MKSSVYFALEFWFRPLQRDEANRGSERDALGDDSMAHPEHEDGHAAETQTPCIP